MNNFLDKYSKPLAELQKLSHTIGVRPDYVQGRGGNTSVKFDDRLMAIKASGMGVADVTETEGFTVVDYAKLKKFYTDNDPSSFPDLEKAGSEKTLSVVVGPDTNNVLRPSVGTGFHSLLKSYVIHSHSVYMNIAACSNEGIGLVTRLFLDADYDWLWIPYNDPGIQLAVMIEGALKIHYSRRETVPQLIVLQNNGMIVHADSLEECIEIHEHVQSELQRRIRIKDDDYPKPVVKASGKGKYVSATENLLDWLEEDEWPIQALIEDILYPDQFTYLAENLTLAHSEDAVPEKGHAMIYPAQKKIVYRMKEAKALAMEQTIVAVMYILRGIRKMRYSPRTIDESAKQFMGNWESERYRRQLLEN